MKYKNQLQPQSAGIKKSRWSLSWLALAACVILSPNALLGKDDKQTKLVCFGDSITKRGYPELLGKSLKIEAINAGVAGNSSSAGLRRMQKDVLVLKPDIVVIFFGTNDLRADEPRVYVPIKKYEENLKRMVDECRKINAKVVICTLPPIDEKTFFERHETKEFDKLGGLNKILASYRETAIKVAESEKLPVVDLNKKLAEQPEWLSKDGVHPSPEGNEIIAHLIGEAVAPLLEK
ncbi:MAG: GDSL-type esterase/lipase family protein [Akkermansiaceae bacterium]|jgi:lysophospholipase L1-like esterase|nr:GDSL-type esterase/lipase family protein [Akkermansiaceae bacterium]MDP4721929.1 GDSL-type esterase/lipase family protein [Akkermansiaceae bacterium]MDP4779983.1 GDSL-type esterase/lipase family protein [Akkermansiaceae bacterium]MDP4847091.1 GDSL-type esterase/lipase family protein [Akkermansiaceae bacterium]MDP4897204.1 GDSL-type esterase/lipase family protein [Akkermansiaceae bacterium]